ncbi:hypothetical protein NECAME_02793 [Necator americanus]|uniref:Uncharacterized protein n=1 Tax=Necator americanus TaxID=51031 RepID=W2TBF7_NECAM|nr:hypothetical protein NECAME_02793 [Necator americanus]ETN78929.1 hypothetical protein NECAME_02793 [Necator americanus]
MLAHDFLKKDDRSFKPTSSSSASFLLLPIQKPLSQGKSLKKQTLIRIGKLSLVNSLIEVLWFYGRNALQYHIAQNGERTDILLGVFDEKIHKAWIDEDPKHRSPKKYNNQITQVSHIYTKGDICHEVGAHRFCEPLQYADEYGLIALEPHDAFDRQGAGPE